jgi:DNA-binding response OmpR family regulator
MDFVAVSPLAASPRARVLVVDHEEVWRSALATWLSYEFDVVTASDGVEGLERALEATPDAVVSEVAMPRLDGPSMVGRMKQIARLRRVPVLFVSATKAPATVVAAIAAGARAYMEKPVDLDVLERKLRAATSQASSSGARRVSMVMEKGARGY